MATFLQSRNSRNLMELRKTLHRAAYQHKTVKKLEQHMIDILKLMDAVPWVTGSKGRMTISEAALQLDPVAYPKLTDSFVESRLMDQEDPNLQRASEEYKARFLERKLMRMPMSWSLPNSDENDNFHLPTDEVFFREVLRVYESSRVRNISRDPFVPMTKDQLRLSTAKLTYGMGENDPMLKIVFHDKQNQKKDTHGDPDANPHRTRLFLFWNPDIGQLEDKATLQRLTAAAYEVAKGLEGNQEPDTTPASPLKPRRVSGVSLDAATPPVKKRRKLAFQSSCPDDIFEDSIQFSQ
ncbi:Deoxynucleoside triphosphate triphosphohydrolase SAMHD1 [Durusdinium trenchii]|uniref:Deoxynucleoside triphosphate triphosphohydrolase SAMHD1 n=3 Tax=Durusdinium trenchii TaxID=1381693 RepID=A0ABP0R8P7_9DINO